eukprot:2837235-Amphidinium_carterae.1
MSSCHHVASFSLVRCSISCAQCRNVDSCEGTWVTLQDGDHAIGVFAGMLPFRRIFGRASPLLRPKIQRRPQFVQAFALAKAKRSTRKEALHQGCLVIAQPSGTCRSSC